MNKQMRITAGALSGFAAVLMLSDGAAYAQGFWPWSSRRTPPPQQTQPPPYPKKTQPAPQKQKRPSRPGGGGRYRTLCVRTCDGFFFPISFKASRSKFKADSDACLERCGSDARLFVHRNPGQKVSSAVDLQGKRYVDLENAFRFRKELVPGCECNAGFAPDPPAATVPAEADAGKAQTETSAGTSEKAKTQ